MQLDLVIAGARIDGHEGLMDIGVSGGRIVAIAASIATDAPREEAAGALLFPGFVETHIHLDKACILERCHIHQGTLAEAVAETARAKAAFTSQDVYDRAAHVLEKAIVNGTTRMRSFVEIDPRAGFRSFEAILQVKRDYAFAIDLEICAFAQEGLTHEMDTYVLLDAALAQGADLVGGCPYTDADPAEHVRLIFDLAEKHGVAVDFHLDFDLNPLGSGMPAVIAETRARGYGGRVSIGHVTKLSAMPRGEVELWARRLANAGVALTVLPATDLFLTGRDADRLVPRGLAPAHLLRDLGVTTSLASNNILNPFTPYGDAALGRMANLYANVSQLARPYEIEAAFDMVTGSAARLLGRSYGLAEGAPADMVLLDAPDPVAAIREIAAPLAGWKAGRKTFLRNRAKLLRP